MPATPGGMALDWNCAVSHVPAPPGQVASIGRSCNGGRTSARAALTGVT
jgi:hypothetical protein